MVLVSIEGPRKRVVYFRIGDLGYPRNSRIREALKGRGFSIEIVSRDHGRHPSRVRTVLRQFWELWKLTHGASIVVVAEFESKFSLPVWLICKLRRSLLVVDGFVGLHETYIGDMEIYSRLSGRALVYRLLDRVAFFCASVYLVDTDVRAAAISRKGILGRVAPVVVTLPVGSPKWAGSVGARRVDETAGAHAGAFRMLFYGNYLPLHGVPVILEALALMDMRTEVTLSLIGGGERRANCEEFARREGLAGFCSFIDPIDESELPRHILEADLVLGVFGNSAKAGSVIANKVWQGLSAGRIVVTRESAALSEIAAVVGSQLVTVPPRDPVALARVLDDLVNGVRSARIDRDVFIKLEAYVRMRFDIFLAIIEDALR